MSTATTPKTIDKDRGTWTSASNAAADNACGGRHLAQRGIPDRPSDDSKRGSRIHAALATQMASPGDSHINRKQLDALNLEERETYDACKQIEAKLVSQYFGQKLPEELRVVREQRFWTKLNSGQQEIAHSGQADVVWTSPGKALVLDFKTLASDVPESPRNLQLRDLACLVRGSLHPQAEIAVAIVQPYVTHKPELCVYSPADLDRATQEMFQRILRSNNPQSKRVAGELQCKFCKAKSRCPEYQHWAGQMTPPAMLNILGVPLAQWTGQQCAQAANALGPCLKFLDEVKEELKTRLEKDPASVPGWTLQPGAKRETITNAQGVFDRFAGLGGKVEQFMGCITVGKAKLREAVNSVTGAKGKALDAAMDTLTKDCVQVTEGAPSLKRVKPEAKA